MAIGPPNKEMDMLYQGNFQGGTIRNPKIVILDDSLLLCDGWNTYVIEKGSCIKHFGTMNGDCIMLEADQRDVDGNLIQKRFFLY